MNNTETTPFTISPTVILHDTRANEAGQPQQLLYFLRQVRYWTARASAEIKHLMNASDASDGEKERNNEKEKSPCTPLKRKETKRETEHFAQTLFERFWCAYPRKVGKKMARRAFLRLIAAEKDPEALLARLLAAVAEQTVVLDWCAERREFIPHAATWINGERWNDDLSVARSNPQLRGGTASARHADNWRGTRKEDIDNVLG